VVGESIEEEERCVMNERGRCVVDGRIEERGVVVGR
jgi:hypothetical protein